MKISACTLIRNATIYDYPIIESIKSSLPYVDEYIVNIGDSNDNTSTVLSVAFKNEPKVKMFGSVWEGKELGTTFFSHQTNLAIDKAEGDWVLYLQADECIHENDGPALRRLANLAESENKQGVTLKYHHFEKAPNLVRKTYEDGFDAYDKEIRLFKNNGRLVSFGDGQSFAFTEDLTDPRGPQPALHRKEFFLDSNVYIYHYGYLKDPVKLYNKKRALDEFYRVSEPDRHEDIKKDEQGNYIFNDGSKLKPFYGTHPEVMADRIRRFL